MNEYMKKALDKAFQGLDKGEGSPFGALVLDADGEILSVSNNRIRIDNDPTQHAEMVAIRDACKKIGDYRLDGCTIYSTCLPCPMCLSAIIWAGIENVYYGCDDADAEKIGFDDKRIYEHFRGERNMVELKQIDRDACMELFDYFEKDRQE